MKLVIPGKTFLVGEYAVLVGGRALGVATEPYFQTEFDDQHMTSVHENSAAGLLLKSIGLTKMEINSVVSSYGVGGFGQSTAEFIATWFHNHTIRDSDVPTFLKNIFNQYRDLFDIHPDLQKIKPSGADLITQLMGKITYFDPEVIHSKSLNWAFPEIDFDIISTGVKVATHEHLATLDLKSLEPLCDLSENVLSAYLSINQEQFLDSMNEWSLKLIDLGLQHNHSLDLKQLLEKCPEVMLAKPNGALGADTITVFYKSANKYTVREYLKNNNILYVTGLDGISRGAHYVD
jgi:mevalonate kinase